MHRQTVKGSRRGGLSVGKAVRRQINLALQGGGAHGAFAWGVLDELLEEDGLSFGWISATSAGAVNAVALASGLAAGGASEAQDTLRRVWNAVEAANVPDLQRFNPFLFGLSRAAPISGMPNLLSPYEFNPLGFDPLRRLLADQIDFERIRVSSPVELLIAATDVLTGRARLFRRAEMSVDAVLASACLPTLHHAVMIDGRAYWDGGFSANPDLVTLATESPVEDTLIVQLNPLQHRTVPRSASEINDRVNTFTFNQPLLRDIETIIAAKETPLGWFPNRQSRTARLQRHRFHLIEASPYTAGLRADTKLKPDGELLAYLHEAGRKEARQWLEQHAACLGRRSTVDLRARYLEPSRSELQESAPSREPRAAAGRA